MRLYVTGGAGFVGRFIVDDAVAAGDNVTVMSRRPPAEGFFSAPVRHVHFDLEAVAPDLRGVDALVHLALDHLPGCYRGGEGDDANAFRKRNLDGTIALFRAAAEADVGRVIFLSSRAVYGAYPPGTRLTETLEPRPDTLYGRIKRAAEIALAECCGARRVSLRATGVYGPAGAGARPKWADLFDAFRSGAPIEPRVATEVHGADVASAVRLLLTSPIGRADGILNVSDLVLDRRDLLREVAALTGWEGRLPDRSACPPSVMDAGRLRSLGWSPGGWPRLRATLPDLV